MAILSKASVLAGLGEAIRIRQGHSPDATDLADAPVLSGWALEPISAGMVRLVGVVQGHPLLEDGSCTTSAVLAIDAERRWARTVSRYYALAESLEDLTE